MRTKYYTVHPRNFGNEYSTIKVETKEDDERLNNWYLNESGENCRMYRRTVAELRQMASEERWNRKHDQAFSGYCSPWDAISVENFLHPAF